MSIYGIGVDLINHTRIQSLYAKYGDRFARRILDDDEMILREKYNITNNTYNSEGKSSSNDRNGSIESSNRNSPSTSIISVRSDNGGPEYIET